MKIIMFAGGTGKRFWPASRKSAPKQFLPVIGDKPLISLKYDYLRQGYAPEDIYMSTGLQFENEVRELLPELPPENIILEPEMRDNGPAVLYAVSYVAQKYPDELVSIQWSDHYIKKPDVFVKALKESEKIVKESGKSIIVGVPARFASPHRGYIKFGKKLRNLDNYERLILAEFVRFVEKPTKEVAKEYLRSGDYAWNPAYFITTPKHILEKYETFAPEMFSTIQSIVNSNYHESEMSKYKGLEKVGFDYIYSENLSPEEAYVLNVDMGWNDVGEWISLKEALEEHTDDVVTSGNVLDMGSKDCVFFNYEDKELIATINLENLVVVNTKDVVAIFHKDDNDKLKHFLKALEEKGKEEFL